MTTQTKPQPRLGDIVYVNAFMYDTKMLWSGEVKRIDGSKITVMLRDQRLITVGLADVELTTKQTKPQHTAGTPRTDAVDAKPHQSATFHLEEMRTHARALERENDELVSALEEAKEALEWYQDGRKASGQSSAVADSGIQVIDAALAKAKQ